MSESAAVSTQTLKRTIEGIDRFASESLSQIVSITRLALVYMETPNAYRFPEHIANALSAIQTKADMLENDINYAAEEVGCNHKNDRRTRIFNAQNAAKA